MVPRIEFEKLSHDIYLAGGWEKYSKVPYKTIIKEALQGLDIYDPEEYQDGDWFEYDLEAIRNSNCIICYANSIPMSAACFELGYFYALQREKEINLDDSGTIILIWDDITPENAKKWHARSGYVVPTVEDAIELYKTLYNYDSDLRF